MVKFYGTQMTPSDLLQPIEAEWPTVSLARVVDTIRHGSHLELRFFPHKWIANAQAGGHRDHSPTVGPLHDGSLSLSLSRAFMRDPSKSQ